MNDTNIKIRKMGEEVFSPNEGERIKQDAARPYFIEMPYEWWQAVRSTMNSCDWKMKVPELPEDKEKKRHGGRAWRHFDISKKHHKEKIPATEEPAHEEEPEEDGVDVV